MGNMTEFLAKCKRLVLPALVLLAVGFAYLVQYRGGQNGVPSWNDLHAWLGVSLNAPSEEVLAGETTVTFLDVGQGDAVLIGQAGHFCLIDAGPADQRQNLVTLLQQSGVERLDLMVLTHPHADHIGGALAVLKAIPTERLLVSTDQVLEDGSAWQDDIFELAAQQGIPVTVAQAGQQYPIGEGTLTVLLSGYVPGRSLDDPLNAASVCIRFTAGGFSYLATGDAEAETEAALAEQYGEDLRSTLFKAGHHGSYTSNSEELLQLVRPQAVGISCGLNNDYGHPHAAALASFAAVDAGVWRTDRQGTVTFVYDADGLHAVSEMDAELSSAA